MQSGTAVLSTAKKSLWAGRILTGVATLFLLMDSVMHLLKPIQVVDAFTRLGFPIGLSVDLGIIELLCLVLYLIPRTAILGAILLTGYLEQCGRHPYARWQFLVRNNVPGLVRHTGLGGRLSAGCETPRADPSAMAVDGRRATFSVA